MKLKFEKINMKWVMSIGVGLILVLTLLFILFRTNLILDNGDNKDKKTNTNTSSNTGSNTNTNTNTNTNIDPDYEDKKEYTISKEAKERTKPVARLNSKEKVYVIEENIMEYLLSLSKEIIAHCTDTPCTLALGPQLTYTLDGRIGFTVKGCEGDPTFQYDKAKAEFIVDMSKVVCKES